jgi:hypothetical protein
MTDMKGYIATQLHSHKKRSDLGKLPLKKPAPIESAFFSTSFTFHKPDTPTPASQTGL